MVDMTVKFRLPAGCYKSYCGKCGNALKLPLIVPSTSDRARRCFPIRQGCCTLQSHKGLDSGRRGSGLPTSGSISKGKCGNGNWEGNRGKILLILKKNRATLKLWFWRHVCITKSLQVERTWWLLGYLQTNVRL